MSDDTNAVIKTEYVRIDPDIDGMKRYLEVVAREDDDRVLWGLRMAWALGIADWYADTLADKRGWKS